MANYPKQKLSFREKTVRPKEGGLTWGENNVDFISEQTLSSSNTEEMLQLLRLTGDKLNEKDYEYVLNPFNTTVEKYKRFGAKLRNYNIISPVLDLFKGEFGKRLNNVQVVGTSENVDSDYTEFLSKKMTEYIAQAAVNALNEAGVDTGVESQEQQPQEEQLAEVESTWKEMAIMHGSEVLDYITFNENLDEKYIQMYMDWITVGTVISYKEVEFDDVKVTRVDPLEFYCSFDGGDGLGDETFIEDANWACKVEVNDMLDKFYDELTEDQVNALSRCQDETNISTGSSLDYQKVFVEPYENSKYSLSNNSRSGLVYYHVVWKSMSKVGVLTRAIMGQIEEIEVDDTYTLDPMMGDMHIEWGWISDVWEGHKLEHTGIEDIYLKVRPLPYDRADLNNKSMQKLPYNGRRNRTRDGSIVSLCKTGYPYQILYNVVRYQMERMINKNMDKMMVMPIGLLPKGKEGWDEEKAMYFARATGTLYIDEAAPNAGLAIQAIKSIDLSLNTYIDQSNNLLASIKADFWEAVGMNRQRYGDVKASDGKGANEEAIFRSAVISEELNRQFEKFQETDYNGIIDLSKIAYIHGKKGAYINSSQSEDFLDLNDDDIIHHTGTSYGVFVKNSTEEAKKIEALKQYMFSYAQNGGSPEALMESLDLTNFTKGKKIIADLDAQAKQLEESLQRDQMESQQAMAEEANALKQAEMDLKREEFTAKNQTDIYIAELKESNNVEVPEPDTSVDDMVKVSDDRRKDRELDHKISKENKELSQGDEELAIKRKVANKPTPTPSAKK